MHVLLIAALLGSPFLVPPPSGGFRLDGTARLNLDLAGYYITDSTGAAHLCGAGTAGHGIGTGGGFCSGAVDIDGIIYSDGGIDIAGMYGVYSGSYAYGIFMPRNTYQTNQGLTLHTGTASNSILIIEAGDRNTNFAHAAQTDPTIFQHSADATDITQFNAQSWNALKLGGDGAGYGCINETFAYDDMTDGGGAVGTFDMTETIPDGAVVQRAILHTLTGFAGDVSAAFTIGDGTDVDRYNTGTPSVFTTNASGVDLGIPSGTAWHDDAKTVTITITTNADFTSVSAGQATVGVCYWTP